MYYHVTHKMAVFCASSCYLDCLFFQVDPQVPEVPAVLEIPSGQVDWHWIRQFREVLAVPFPRVALSTRSIFNDCKHIRCQPPS